MADQISDFTRLLFGQVAVSRALLENFKKALEGEFLGTAAEVHEDWRFNARSLTYLMGPAYEFINQAWESGPSEQLQRVLRTNMSRLVVVHEYLVRGCDEYESTLTESGFDDAKQRLLSAVGQSEFACREWGRRIGREADESRLFVEIRGQLQEAEFRERWNQICSHDLPVEFWDVQVALRDLKDATDALRQDASPENLVSDQLTQNPLLKTCMKSRRMVLTVLHVVHSQRCGFSFVDLRECVNALQDAGLAGQDAISVHLGESSLSGSSPEVVSEGMRLLKVRLAYLVEFFGASLEMPQGTPADFVLDESLRCIAA